MSQINSAELGAMPLGAVPLPAGESFESFVKAPEFEANYSAALDVQVAAFEAHEKAAGIDRTAFTLSVAHYASNLSLADFGLQFDAPSSPAASLEGLKFALAEPTKVETIFQGTSEQYLQTQMEQQIINKAAAERAAMEAKEAKTDRKKTTGKAGGFIGPLISSFLKPAPAHA